MSSWAEERDGGFLPRYRVGRGAKVSLELVSFTERRTKSAVRREAERLAAEAERAASQGWTVGPRAGKVTVAELASEMFATIEAQGRLAPKTLERDRGLMTIHVLPRWGHVSVRSISPTQVQQWTDDLVRRGDLAPSTVVKVHGQLEKVIAHAVRLGILASSPCAYTIKPKVVPAERHAYSAATVATVMSHLHPHYRLLVKVLFLTGMRISEAAGLQVRDLDAINSRVRVERQLQETGGGLVASTPKTDAGHRWVPVPRDVMAELADRVRGLDADASVFTTHTGAPFRAANFRNRHWYPACEAAGVERILPHELRNSALTNWARTAKAPNQMKEWAGHSDIRTSLGIYVKVLDETTGDDVTELEGLFGGQPPGGHLRAV